MSKRPDKWHWVEIPITHPAEVRPVRVVASGMMATGGIADGRLLPVLLVDLQDRPDARDMIAVHERFESGDVDSCWMKRSRWSRDVGLLLSFKRPVQCNVFLEFVLTDLGPLVHQIINAQGFYLQEGAPGDRVSDSLGRPRILVEVPSAQFREQWERLFVPAIERRFRKQGRSKREAKELARSLIETWDAFAQLRMPEE